MAETSNPKVTPLRAGDDIPGVAGTPTREPPHNFEAEQALLGAILTNNLAYGRVSEFLRPEHFAHPAHGRIFDAATRLIEKGQVANATTLKNLFDQDADLDACRRILAGEQTMTIYKPLKLLAEQAAESAVALAKKQPIKTTASYDNGKREVPTVQVDIIAVHKGNIRETVVKDGFHKEAELFGK